MEQTLAAETLVLRECLAKLSAIAGLNREAQRTQQRDSQLTERRGTAVVESRDVQEQLAS